MTHYSLLTLVTIGIFAPSIPMAYREAVRELLAVRLEVQASTAPCPNPPPGRRCRWRIEAKRLGQWQVCNGVLPPSGAALPSHRYFKIVPNCQFAAGIPLLLPAEVVYR